MDADLFLLRNCDLLLQEIQLLRQRIEQEEKANQTYNILRVIRKSSDEVNLHSKIIADLLNPGGSHHSGDFFLYSFLEIAGISVQPAIPVTVLREHNYIDVFIRIGDHIIIIENKIYASDQDRQLEKYWKYCRSLDGVKTINVVYLSPDGHNPSDVSLGEELKLDEVTIISYKYHIFEWLKLCIRESARHPELRESLVQYREIVNEISGRPIDMKYEKELVQILMKNDNLKNALIIKDGMAATFSHIQKNIWGDFEKRLENSGYSIGSLDAKTWSHEFIDRFYRNEQKSRYYGLSIYVENYSDEYHLEHRVEIEHQIYHGFLLVDKDGQVVIVDNEELKDLANNIKLINDRYNSNTRWLGWCYESTGANLLTFENEGAQSLTSTEGQKEFVDNLFSEVEQDISRYLNEHSIHRTR